MSARRPPRLFVLLGALVYGGFFALLFLTWSM